MHMHAASVLAKNRLRHERGIDPMLPGDVLHHLPGQPPEADYRLL